jgi:hypothetical protein
MVTIRAPDLRLLAHQMTTMVERITKLEASNTRAVAALNDVVRKRVTPGEVEALHLEMKEFLDTKFIHDFAKSRPNYISRLRPGEGAQ